MVSLYLIVDLLYKGETALSIVCHSYRDLATYAV